MTHVLWEMYSQDGTETMPTSVSITPQVLKYYEYGQNMLMFTHGDKEKPADMPLIMATEQPRCLLELSTASSCGHLHKEMVNEYRGIKVRFLPSICPNDEWHKQMLRS